MGLKTTEQLLDEYNQKKGLTPKKSDRNDGMNTSRDGSL